MGRRCRVSRDGYSRLLSQDISSDMASAASTIISEHKINISSVGVNRVQEIREMNEGSDEWDYASLELEAWEKLIVALSKLA